MYLAKLHRNYSLTKYMYAEYYPSTSTAIKMYFTKYSDSVKVSKSSAL